ncbi:hypothetical protein [Flammeovirga aprica]|uniref:Uncharacterized protein n=1 Tax=Flammeovirga aprica JL-4 TaxID=694437 RepID=A0A7X9S1G3_9BACT|nr:hypothetical protein [Flammeovirga aprica]NME72620.1 hypothetical protein [Flammeovirga aprica JL-4]
MAFPAMNENEDIIISGPIGAIIILGGYVYKVFSLMAVDVMQSVVDMSIFIQSKGELNEEEKAKPHAQGEWKRNAQNETK